MSRIELSDGSSWPRPELETDDEVGLEWRLRHLHRSDHTPRDLLAAAEIVSAYGYLVAESTRAKRDLVCREMRTALGCGDGIDTTPERVHETGKSEHIQEDTP